MKFFHFIFRYIFLLITVVILTGCSETTLEANAFKRLRPSLKDPDSYKLISIEAIDTLTEYDNINNAIIEHERMQEMTLALIDEALAIGENKKDATEELKRIDQYFIDIRTDSSLISFLERKLQTASKYRVCAIKYTYRFRYLNDAGLMAPGMYYMWANPDGTVIQLAETEKKLDPSPITIPGYEKLMEDVIDMAILMKDSIEINSRR